MSFIPRPYEIYKHFKGNLYQITAVAQHTETGELLVVYQALYGDFKIYARPLGMFLSEVDRQKYPDAGQQFRFELQGESEQRREEREADCGAEGRKLTQSEPEEDAVEVPTAKTEAAEISDIGWQKNDYAEDVSKAQNVARDEVRGVEQDEAQLALDPLVLEFLDADTYEERLNILAGLHHRITDDMITTMAVACDIEVPEGETEARYASLKSCLLTLEKFECNRLR